MQCRRIVGDDADLLCHLSFRVKAVVSTTGTKRIETFSSVLADRTELELPIGVWVSVEVFA
jgi:hypothetical protein